MTNWSMFFTLGSAQTRGLSLYEAIRERCREIWGDQVGSVSEKEFDYRYSFAVFGCAGMIRAWVNRNCQETDLQMAELADRMIRRGTIDPVG